MKREIHEKASKLWNAISQKKREIADFKTACNGHDILWVGNWGVGVDIKGKGKKVISQIIAGLLDDELDELEKDYESL
jgi:hypothetical protein